MLDVHQRLVRCFSAVFPQLDEPEVIRSSMDSQESWDSLAFVNLLGVVEEEFGVEITPENIGQLGSFEDFMTYLTVQPTD